MKWTCFVCASLAVLSACAETDSVKAESGKVGSGKGEPIVAEPVKSEPFISQISVAYGQAPHDTDIYRVAVRHDSGYQWLSNPTGWLSLYYEASLNLWTQDDDSIYAAAVSPVLIYYFGKPEYLVHPYFEAGIGPAVISETEMNTRQFSTAFQFEDRLGVGVQVKHFDACFRYMHYSNGSIEQPNDGIDIFMVALGYRL